MLAHLDVSKSALPKVFEQAVFVANHLGAIHAFHRLHLAVALRPRIVRRKPQRALLTLDRRRVLTSRDLDLRIGFYAHPTKLLVPRLVLSRAHHCRFQLLVIDRDMLLVFRLALVIA